MSGGGAQRRFLVESSLERGMSAFSEGDHIRSSEGLS